MIEEVIKVAGAVTAGSAALVALYKGHVWAREQMLCRNAHRALIEERIGKSIEIGEANSSKLRFIESELRTNGGSSVKDLLLKVSSREDVADQIRRVLADDLEVCLFETDSEGLCTWVNATYARTIGMPASGFTGYGWVNAIHPDDREDATSDWDTAVRQERDWRGELRFRTVDGRVLRMHGSAVPLRSGSRVVGYFGQLSVLGEA